MSSRKRHLLAMVLATSACIILLTGMILLTGTATVSPHHSPLMSVPVSLNEFTPEPKAPTQPVTRPDSPRPEQKHTREETPKSPKASQSTPAQTPQAQKIPPDSPKTISTAEPEVKPTPKPEPAHKPVKPVKQIPKAQPQKPQRIHSPPSSKSSPAPTLPQKPMSAPSVPAAKPLPQAEPETNVQAVLRLKQIYLNELRQTIARLAQDTYPSRARRRGQHGEVVLHFTLLPDGRIENLTLQNSSGFYLLDEAAKAVIEEEMNSRYKPFPPGLPKNPITITLPIRYQLQ